ncbi:Retrovirus-related Pol polyprotein like [Argiope bruennichi]|uniref:Retrovirus-related Pol polyprotein like n=1 Tax=Argiope bruennichi TaxID=94029 RepID=A0A8T0FPN7_ARGBR|nr:Retrovirus-related Pol polyprotein like [Argiope bruennichi]
MSNKHKIVNKGTVIASCDPVMDIAARPQEFSGAHPPQIFENLVVLDEQQQRDVRKLLNEFQSLSSEACLVYLDDITVEQILIPRSSTLIELCKLLGIEKTRTTALHPESDGMVESFNLTILNNLSIFVSKNQTDWDVHLPVFLLINRGTEHEATRLTPAEMLFDQTLRLPCDILFGRPSETPTSPNEYMKDLEARLESIHAFTRESNKLASELMKTRYDSRATDYQFKEDDLV